MKAFSLYLPRTLAAAVIACTMTASLTACTPDNVVSDGQRSETLPSLNSNTSASTLGLEDADSVLKRNIAVHLAEPLDTTSVALIDVDKEIIPDGVTLDGDTLRIDKEGTYSLTGTLEGHITVNVPDGQVQLLLNGLSVTSPWGPALIATEVGELTIVLVENTKNLLADSADQSDNGDRRSALYSEGNTTISGKGALTVRGKLADGIISRRGLLISGGKINVTAVDEAVRGDDYVAITDGNITVSATGKAITSPQAGGGDGGFVAISGGSITVNAGQDAIAVATDAIITGGTLDLTAGDENEDEPTEDASAVGIRSGSITVLEGGRILITAQDEGINSLSHVHLNGATVSITSQFTALAATQRTVMTHGSLKVKDSMNGIVAGEITLAGASVDIKAHDVAVKTSGATDPSSLTLSDGTLAIRTQGAGIESAGAMTVHGGTLRIDNEQKGARSAIASVGPLTVSGGHLFTVGASQSPREPARDSQTWVAFTGASIGPKDTIEIRDEADNVIYSATSRVSGEFVFLCDSYLNAGASYSLYVNGSGVANSRAL